MPSPLPKIQATVLAVNKARQTAFEVFNAFRPVLLRWVGKKIKKADGGLVKALVDELPQMNVKGQNTFLVWFDNSQFSLRWGVRASASDGSISHSYEDTVTLGEIDNGVLKCVFDNYESRGDYTVEEVIGLIADAERAQKALDAAKSKLYPFGNLASHIR